MKRAYILTGIVAFLLLPIAVNAQTVSEIFRQGHEMMEAGKVSDASAQLFNKGYNVQRTSGGVVLGKSNTSDVRLASANSSSQQLDTVRMELKINTDFTSLTSELQRLGYQLVENRGGASVYQNGAIKVAVFNPYDYKDYKFGFFFARDKNAVVDEVITVRGVSFKMVGVHGGTFMMGSNDSDADDNEKPVHQVTLSTFSIGETEVTQELWQAVMGDNPSWFKGPKRPVEEVSWDDCQTFIDSLNSLTGRNFRLPTEAEWEYAARGGKRSNGYKYAGSNNIEEVAWYQENCYEKGRSSPDYGTHNVATKRANELGLYDMSGNVFERCQDWYDDYSSSAQTNPKGPSSGFIRVYHGGSWGDYAGSCRVSYRRAFSPSRFGCLGLRLAE